MFFSKVSRVFLAVFVLALASGANAGTASQTSNVDLGPNTKLETINSRTQNADYRGRKALQLMALPGHEMGDAGMVALIPDLDFKDGTIEVEVAGAPRPGAPANMKGFIGLSFRVQSHGSAAETVYIRPVNARLDDQLVRNHTAQYVSEPDYSWQRLRKESPGVYESYVDVETGAWTKLKIEVAGTKARLYVNGAAQPCLVVNDLKMGETHGQIGLWSHETTLAYFSNLKVTSAK